MKSKQSHLILLVLLCGAFGVTAGISLGRNTARAEESTFQDPAGLDRRISQLEQRFYQVESSINRLQQYVSMQRTPTTQSGVNDRDLALVREEVQRLSQRMDQVECGLVKLDERTAAANRKRDAARLMDPCRTDVGAPVRLLMRP